MTPAKLYRCRVCAIRHLAACLDCSLAVLSTPPRASAALPEPDTRLGPNAEHAEAVVHYSARPPADPIDASSRSASSEPLAHMLRIAVCIQRDLLLRPATRSRALLTRAFADDGGCALPPRLLVPHRMMAATTTGATTAVISPSKIARWLTDRRENPLRQPNYTSTKKT